jgi:hypothetical protein
MMGLERDNKGMSPPASQDRVTDERSQSALSPPSGSVPTGARFTPGPWHVVEGHSIVSIKADGIDIADTSSKRYYQSFDQTDRANAHLIAAAPDMFEALEAVVATSPIEDSVLPMVLAALSKARGPHS